MTSTGRVFASFAALVAGILLAAGAAGAGMEQPQSGGRLSIDPSCPVPGSSIRIRYQAVPELADQEKLRLRARLRLDNDSSYLTPGGQTLARLHRSEPGIFEAEAILPADVVFAALAVETTASDRFDDHDGKLWDLLTCDDNGQVTWSALEQQFRDLSGRNHERLLAAARQMVRLFPNQPTSWTNLRFALSVAGLPDKDGTAEVVQSQLARLDNELRQIEHPKVEHIAALAQAFWFRAPEAHEYWLTRLMQTEPDHPFVIELEIMEAFDRHPDDPATTLEMLEQLWLRAGESTASGRVSQAAMVAAGRVGKPEALLVWAKRSRQYDSVEWPRAAYQLLAHEMTRSIGIDYLQASLEALKDADAQRWPGESPDAYRSRVAETLGEQYTRLATALVSNGHPDEAQQALMEAAAHAWRPERIEALIDSFQQVGDRASANTMRARLAAHPASTPDQGADLFNASTMAEEQWQSAVSESRQAMLEYTASQLLSREVPPISLTTVDSGSTTLADIGGNQPLVMMYWSTGCAFSVQELPTLTDLGSRGHQIVAVTSQSVAHIERWLQVNQVDTLIAHDLQRQAARAFNNWATPTYYVLDGDGHWRFDGRYADDVLRVLETLEAEGATADRF